MAGIVVFAIIGVIVALIVKGAGSTSTYQGLVAKGKPAQGILLSVSSTSTRLAAGSAGRPGIELRGVVVDVEVPGQPPYEVNGFAMFPTNLRGDVLPGATVELRVDPKNKSRVAVVGPSVGLPSSLLPTRPT